MSNTFTHHLHDLDRFAAALSLSEEAIPFSSAWHEKNVNTPAHHNFNRIIPKLISAHEDKKDRDIARLHEQMDAADHRAALDSCRGLLLFDSANPEVLSSVDTLMTKPDTGKEATALRALIPLGDPKLEFRSRRFPLQVHWNEATETYWVSHNNRIDEMDEEWNHIRTVLDLDFYRSPFTVFNGDNLYCNSCLTRTIHHFSLSEEKLVRSVELDLMVGISYLMPDGSVLLSCYDDARNKILVHFDADLNEIRRTEIARCDELGPSGEAILTIMDNAILVLSNPTSCNQKMLTLDPETLKIIGHRTIEFLPSRFFSVIPHNGGFLASGINHMAVLDENLKLVHFKHQPNVILNLVRKVKVRSKELVFGFASHSREVFSYSLEP